MRKNHFTLIELLLVFAILAFVAGLFGLNAARTKQENQFKSEVDLLVADLNLCQDFMFIFNSNLSLKIERLKGEDTLTYSIIFDTPLPEEWQKKFNRPPHTFTAIKGVSFKDKNILNEKDQEDVVEIKFRSLGSALSKGELIVFDKGQENQASLKRYIALTGEPVAIVSKTHPSYSEKNKNGNFDIELTEKTYEEVNAVKE